jgi:hypothetical protein
MRRFLLVVCAAVASALFAFPVYAAVQTATNGILTINLQDAGAEIGQFEVKTGASFPVHPDAFVIFPIGTSYVTLRDVTGNTIYANAGGTLSSGLGGFTFQSLQAAPCVPAVVTVAGGFQVTYTCPNWTVVQTVVIIGTSLADTAVRHTVAVTNTSGVTRSYGVRYMWDWFINSNDASIFRERSPDTPFQTTFQGFNNPAFQAFEEVDNIAAPSFSIFGTVHGGPLVPAPTQPDMLGYTSWGTSYANPWDFAITGGNSDSSTVHYFGFAAPLSIAAGATTTFVEYMTTQQSAIGLGPVVANDIPTLTEWGLIALALLLGGAAFVSLRRRGSIGSR